MTYAQDAIDGVNAAIGAKGRPPRPPLPWRWACRTVAVVGTLAGLLLLIAGQAPMECVALEQASLVFAVLSLRP